MKNKMIAYVIVVIVLIAGAFYGGMKYGQGNALSPQAFQNMTPAQRQQLFTSVRGGSGQANRGETPLGGNGFVTGEIINQTDQNITVKLRDGNSKIVLLAASTKIKKSVDGQKTDLVIGKQVSINGMTNSDGTLTAGLVTIVPPIVTPSVNNPASANGQNNPAPTSPVTPVK